MKKYVAALAVILVAAGGLAVSGQQAAKQQSAPAAGSCEKLTSLMLPSTTVMSARPVAPGTFTAPTKLGEGAGLPQGRGNADLYRSLPAFCRLIGVVKPVPGSAINFEVWLPDNWNGTFQGIGNGTWAGDVDYNGMANAVLLGAATAATDAGHTGHDGTFYNWQTNREQVIDFDWRAFRETTLKAKAVIKAHYGRDPTLAYLVHPGGGGTRMSMREIQRFPEDYDAVLTGGLATHQTHHAFGQIWVYQATHKTPDSYIPPAKYPAIHQGALNACDAKDGVTDGVILDPAHCAFDPSVLLCKGADSQTCLTAPQVAAAKQIYTAPTTSDTKQTIFGPLMPGSELGWENMAGPKSYPFGTEIFGFTLFKQGAAWDPMTLKFDSATVARADAPEQQPLNAYDPDISKFIARGGKLILMGGWNDNLIAPGVTVDYYELVMKKVGPAARDSVRLFMVPGMMHNPGRTGASAYDIDLVTTLKQWKTSGKAPDSLVFTHLSNQVEDHKVLVCAYPNLATYRGTGATTDPASYACKPGARVGWESAPVN